MQFPFSNRSKPAQVLTRRSSRRLAPSRTKVIGKAAWGGLNLTGVLKRPRELSVFSLSRHKIMRGPLLTRSSSSLRDSATKSQTPLAMLADALRACPCVSRGMMKGRGFGARAQHMPRRIFRRGRWCQCCRGCPWEAGLFGAAGSDDVVLIAMPTARGWVLATIRRESLPKRCL